MYPSFHASKQRTIQRSGNHCHGDQEYGSPVTENPQRIIFVYRTHICRAPSRHTSPGQHLKYPPESHDCQKKLIHVMKAAQSVCRWESLKQEVPVLPQKRTEQPTQVDQISCPQPIVSDIQPYAAPTKTRPDSAHMSLARPE